MNGASKQHLADYISTHFPEQVREKVPEADEGSQYCLDLLLYDHALSEDEQEKHAVYETAKEGTSLLNGGWVVEDHSRPSSKKEEPEHSSDILDSLTTDDVRQLIETEDEMSQAKG